MSPPGIEPGKRVAVVDLEGKLLRVEYVTRITRSTIRVAPLQRYAQHGIDREAYPWPLSGALGGIRLRAVTAEDERELRLRPLRAAVDDAARSKDHAASCLADNERKAAEWRAEFARREVAEREAITALEAEEAKPIDPPPC